MTRLLPGACAVMLGLSAATARAGGERRCGDLVRQGAGGYDVRAVGVGCRTARRVARQWERECATRDSLDCEVSSGFECRYRVTGDELGSIRCKRGRARVRFTEGA